MSRPLQQLLDDVRAAFNCAACSFAELDEEEGELIYGPASGVGAAAIAGVRLPVTRGIAGWVAMSGQPLAVSDLGNDPRFASDVARSTEYVPRTLLAAPVAGPEGVLGVLSILDRDTARPDAHRDIELAASYAAKVADVVAAPASLPPELGAVAELLRNADPQQREVLRDGLHRILDEYQ